MEIKSKGVVLFAYNSGYDYVKIANVAAALAKSNLKVPVTLITDVFGMLQADLKYFDNVIDVDAPGSNIRTFRGTNDESSKTINWKNLNRASVYELSPYDQTLLIDCDFLPVTENLKYLFDTKLDFTCFDSVHDITGQDSFNDQIRLNDYSIPQLWATVIYFTKCDFSKALFTMMGEVKDNYSYYAKLYGFKEHYGYRNDFALSIAHHALSGYGSNKHGFIPWKLMTLSSMVNVVECRHTGWMVYDFMIGSKKHRSMINSTDLHVMNKDSFTDKLIEDILESHGG